MKRIEIIEVKVDGRPATVGAGGVIGNFKPGMRVEIKLRSKLKTAIVASRDGRGIYVSRRIEEGGEFTLKAVSNDYLFLHPQNLVQFVWAYQGALKIMSVGVIRRHNQVKVIEHFVFYGPILPQSENVIFVPGAKAWKDLLWLACEAKILPSGEIKTTYTAKPRLSHLVANQAVVYWWNPLMQGYVSQNGYGGNGYGQALLYHGNKLETASFAAINFKNGIPEGLKRGDVIEFEQLLQSQHGGHNPRITGIKVVKTQ